MSLDQNELKNKLLSVFHNMTDGDDRYFAKEVSAKVAEYAELGSITTTDAGTVPGGVFAGSGNGSISVQSSICENIVYAACKVMSTMSAGGDEYLATQLAMGIDSMLSAGEVSTSVKGTITPPSGTPFTSAGAAKGTFKGVFSTMQAGFLATFKAMAGMTKNGDEYLAEQMALYITTYLKAGVVTTQGQANLSGSIGTGAMS